MPARIWGAVPAIAALLALLLSVGLVACGESASFVREETGAVPAAAATAAPSSRGAVAAPQATQAPMLASEEEASKGGQQASIRTPP